MRLRDHESLSRLGTHHGTGAAGLLALCTVVLLVVGLNPRAFTIRNDVSGLPDGPGIRFAGNGLAHSGRLPVAALRGDDGAFTLLLEFKLLEDSRRRGFEHILTVAGDAADSQLLVGQWQHSLIATNGADYDYRQRLPRLTVSLEPGGRWHVLGLTSTDGGTQLHLDGREVAAMPEPLTLPVNPRLLLGNSVHGIHGWRGMIRGVAVLPEALSEAALSHLTPGSVDWSRSELPDAALRFAFEQRDAGRSANLGTIETTLRFPRDRIWLEPVLFEPGFRDAKRSDVLVNLFGFVPFGFCWTLWIAGAKPNASRGVLLLTGLAAAALLSGAIELAQAWMPQRSSSILDLLLNTSGGLLGAAVQVALWSRRPGGLADRHRES